MEDRRRGTARMHDPPAHPQSAPPPRLGVHALPWPITGLIQVSAPSQPPPGRQCMNTHTHR